MPLEKDVPTRKEIEDWLEEEEQEEKVRGRDVKREYPPDKKGLQELENRKKKQFEAVKQRLDDRFSNIPEHAKEKILSDLDSYRRTPRVKRITRQF